MPLATAEANRLLDAQVGKTAYTLPTIYVGLSSTVPTIAGTNVTEPSGGAYARVATTAATWAAAASGATSNALAITFPAASADWLAGANLAYGVLYDAASAGTLRSFGTIAVPKSILSGDTATIAIGDLDITLS